MSEILETTQSVCPLCLHVLDADLVVRGKAVHMEKRCPQHGAFSAPVWPDVDHYRWTLSKATSPALPQSRHSSSSLGCPSDCGLCQTHLRRPCLVEISLTNQCNLRCPVCFMAAGDYRPQPDPTLSQIEAMLCRIIAQTGPQMAIQLTGGEPTIRPDLFDIIRTARRLGITAIEVNTNGLVIARDPGYAAGLLEAGLTGVYLQFDGLRPEIYRTIRGADLLETKLRAIQHCRQAGMRMILSMTIVEGVNDSEIGAVMDFALENNDIIIGLAMQPAFTSGRFTVADRHPMNMGDVIFRLSEQSHGILTPYDFLPTGCSHALCDAATYILPTQSGFQAPPRLLAAQHAGRESLLAAGTPQGAVLADLAAQLYPESGPGLSILLMNYMDAANMDLRRLRECSMVVADGEGRLLPFCSCQLTNQEGKKISELIELKKTPC